MFDRQAIQHDLPGKSTRRPHQGVDECIDQQLGHAMDGDAERGLFFRGAGRLPFGEQIRSVAELVRHLLTPTGELLPSPA